MGTLFLTYSCVNSENDHENKMRSLIFLQPVAVGGFKQSKAEQGEETWK